ncbi:disease resistance protein RUN1-like [Rosa chinensis]|uniref:disease resistance protein RUN1-like n=1 Tax=Rosa chinensis TaxID=74649 RepID=UPI000D08C55E|nr:disease resistance protein RUN1-like [Rosa chinensis]
MQLACTKDDETSKILLKLQQDARAVKHFSLQNSQLLYRGRIYVPKTDEWRQKIISEFHDGFLGGHAGRARTYKRINRAFAWPGMLADIKQYIAAYHTCQIHHYKIVKPPGLLQPNPIPEMAWSHISMDFIDGLPNSEGKSVIWGTKLDKSLAYHPQTDGQTENLNRNLEQYLRCVVGEKPHNWVQAVIWLLIIPWEKYDVFLSFRGEETRNTFTSHLYEALCRNKIQTYIDDEELERGEEISPALLKAVSESKLSVIIFSKNYASSTWCLDELVQILQCRGAQFVIPIFYDIDPSDVRKQSGSYADAFVKHEERLKDKLDKVLMWRDALTTAANISGFDSQKNRPESKLVKLVVNDILVKLNLKSQISSGLEGLVGIEKHIQQVELLLCLDSPDVQIIGIWGMGGIGKTTIAEVVFDRISSQFEACCFIANVREAETKHGLNDLRNQILRKLLKEENLCMATPRSSFARERLRCTKALIVLDDVSDLGQVECLDGGYHNLFGPGSRIIITSRNKRMLRNGLDGGKIYEVKKLDYDEALDLFHLRACTDICSMIDITLSRKVVDYAGGNPLALKVLGSVFSHCKSIEDWEGELDKLKKFPDENIQNVLRFSYDGLQKHEKDIFLDIACYYKGKHIDDVKRILDASGFCANAGIRLLIDMSVVSIKYSRLEMHDLIQEMGQTIVRNQCIIDPGQRSRLWIAKDVCSVLQNNKGTKAIECLVMTMDSITDLYIKPSAFKKMHNLRLLKFQFERYYYRDSKSCVNKVHLSQGLKCLPQALRILYWDGFPLNSLPSKFCPDNLVELCMRNSRLKRLWNKGLQINLGSLKHIDLQRSEHLADVSALIESPNLESIFLECCRSLVQLPSFFQYLAKLTRLCLYGCSNLKILPEMPGNLETLVLDRTAIEELPSSIWCLEKLDDLGLGSCEGLKNLPSNTCRLNSISSLVLSGCLSLGSLPSELPSGMKYLELSNCKSLRSLPVKLPSGLKYLELSNCKSLSSLPIKLPSGLITLDLSNCKSLGSLPAQLPSLLEDLNLSHCESLRSLPVKLPSGLIYLELSNCKSLRSLPVELPGVITLDLSNCKSLESLPPRLPSWLEDLNLSNCESLRSLPVKLPSGLITLALRNCKSLQFLPQLPWLLKYLDAHGCTSLERVSSSRIALIKGWDQQVKNFEDSEDTWWPEELVFINCLKLDQSAWSNIMADAQLRIVRIATLSQLLSGCSWGAQLRIVCPGNEIPKWFSYQSEGCSINIKLPPHWFRQGFLGYALCIVVSFNNYTPPNIKNSNFCCETHYKTNNRDHLPHESCGQLLLEHGIVNSDHVFVWCFYPEFVRLPSAIKLSTCEKVSEASFDIILYHFDLSTKEKKLFDISNVRVKRCGVSLLYSQDFENLLGGIDEDVIMEPKQVVEEEDIIIKTKRRRDESEPSGSGIASFKEEDDRELLSQSSKRKINII